MKKIFAVGFLATLLLLTGCGNNNKPISDEKPIVEEKTAPSSTPKELTAEEKAQQESERKDAEEKRQKELEEKEAKLQAEIAKKQAHLDSLLNEGVQLNYEIEKLGKSKYKVSGTTNLPDGMQIMVSLDSRSPVGERLNIPYDESGLTADQYKTLMANSYVGQYKSSIKNGTFVTVFSGQKLSSGEYELTISSPDNDIQSQEIQSILGQGGKNLFGTFVIEDKHGKRIQLEERVYLP